jgi:hypothetical protein
MTECITQKLLFQELGSREVVVDFGGGTITSDAGALLLREVDLANGFIEGFAGCFTDFRHPGYIEHSIEELVAQRIYGVCLGYEDVVDHDALRADPLFATLCGKIDPTGRERRKERDRGNALAGKSTLNRLETSSGYRINFGRYKKIVADGVMIADYFVKVFLKTYGRRPQRLVLDVDATDDPLHGKQEGRFFHGYYDCYCYLPLYIFCDEHLLCAKLRPSNIDASEGALEEVKRIVEMLREKWPEVKILLRGDSGFCREELMGWCEAHGVDYLFGMARNSRLLSRIGKELKRVERIYQKTGEPVRIFKDFTYRTLKSWSRRRRVVAKAEYLPKGPNPRFVVSSIGKEHIPAQQLYEDEYCGRGDMENRIKEQQLYLFSDRTSSATMRANQLRLWFSAMAYVIMNELRGRALQSTEFARATCETIRLKLLKIGAQVKVSVRRVYVSLASGYPYQEVFCKILAAIQKSYPLRC